MSQTRLSAGCGAHANGARLPSVHMQTTKSGDRSGGAAEARRVLRASVRVVEVSGLTGRGSLLDARPGSSVAASLRGV